jgi:type I restriction enzyme S subunit
VDRDFLYYFFDWDKELIKKEQGAGATMIHVSKRSMEARAIPLPPLEEQQRIVAVLDEAFEGLARARAHAEANLQNARDLFESYLANVFGEGTWQEKTLDQISENLDRVRVPITKSKRVAGDIPYYGASGVVDHVADYLFDEDLLLISEDGANLLARTYPIAFSISGKSWVNNHAHVLRFDDPDTQEFVRLYLNSISLEPYVSGMAQPKLNQKQLNRIPIPFPDGDMRTEIVSKAHAISEETQRLERNFEAALQDLDDLRQSLLQKAFAGELTRREAA